jgi:hypothetical protein
MEYQYKYNGESIPMERGKVDFSCLSCTRPRPLPTAIGCVLEKPLMMVIPPQGVHLDCPVHLEGHHIFGPQVTY